MTFSFSRSLLAASLGLSLAFSAAHAFAEPHKQVLADAEQYQPEALKLLERLVNIDSGSGYEPGLKQVSDIAIDELKNSAPPSNWCRTRRKNPTMYWRR